MYNSKKASRAIDKHFRGIWTQQIRLAECRIERNGFYSYGYVHIHLYVLSIIISCVENENGCWRRRQRILFDQNFYDVVERLNNNKACGLDQMPSELIKRAGEAVKDKLYQICNNVCRSGGMINDFEKGIVIIFAE